MCERSRGATAAPEQEEEERGRLPEQSAKEDEFTMGETLHGQAIGRLACFYPCRAR